MCEAETNGSREMKVMKAMKKMDLIKIWNKPRVDMRAMVIYNNLTFVSPCQHAYRPASD